ncbi:RNA polymerase sigma factor [Leptospira idonii]|uniref:RNA polymerase sigma factor n=1 Tax=Leptospira idonii TaxID=1193500 RepID=A0A4R9LXV4_9LEPT|nr:RNA polymerase sigma factor [Leptospira idonii]TGN17261.1 RNA polymerase sigma factor [Leptospira idonii]
MNDPHLDLLDGTLKGDQKSLKELVLIFQEKIFGLSLKFLWDPDDAEDATQEILIKVITNLGGFRKESKLSTWVYRIAVNHLINFKKSLLETSKVRFKLVHSELQKSQVVETNTSEETEFISMNVQAACTHAMLLCLKRNHRMAFLLGEVFQVTGEEGAWIMGITPANFRKKLSRARLRMNEFLGSHCGIANSENKCRCKNRIAYSMQNGRIHSYLSLSEKMKESGEWKNQTALLYASGEIKEVAEIYRFGPNFRSGRDGLAFLKKSFSEGKFQILE